MTTNSEPSDQSGWRDIASAPLKGAFLAIDKDWEVRRCWRHKPSSRTDEILTYKRGGKFHATHWRPLFDPPSSKVKPISPAEGRAGNPATDTVNTSEIPRGSEQSREEIARVIDAAAFAVDEHPAAGYVAEAREDIRARKRQAALSKADAILALSTAHAEGLGKEDYGVQTHVEPQHCTGWRPIASSTPESSVEPDYEADFDWKAAWYALDHDAARSRARVQALRKALEIAARLADQIIDGNGLPFGSARLISDNSRAALASSTPARSEQVSDELARVQPPVAPSGRTGSEAAEGEEKSVCPRCGGDCRPNGDPHLGTCAGPPVPSRPPPHKMMG